MIKQKRCDVYCQRLYCDECGTVLGKAVNTLMTMPPQYVYKCTCGWEKTLPVSYPVYNFVELEEMRLLDSASVMPGPEGKQ